MAVTVSVPLTGSDQAARTGMGHYFGISVSNTHATDKAVVTVYDNTTNSGTILDTFTLVGTLQPHAWSWYGPQGKYVNTGVYVDVTLSGSAALIGSVVCG